MTNITASAVNELRKATGAGMMECKKALQEANGDFDAAVDILRKKGAAKAAKRADREAAEGLAIAVSNSNNTIGIVVEVNCETDFVAKNDDFVAFANEIANFALENQPATLEELKGLQMNGKAITDILVEKTAVIGEKVDISTYNILKSEGVAAYNHGNNRIGVLVALTQGDEASIDAGRDVAMQIAAMNPIAVDESSVSEEVKEKEREIGREQAIAEGKPEQIVDKIAEGKLQKFYKDNTLVHQAFVKDSSKTVAEFLKSVNSDLSVKSFSRVQLGA
ncbi:elongation factor Ts [bacterium]|nr:elongation factor Ts [bacterium]